MDSSRYDVYGNTNLDKFIFNEFIDLSDLEEENADMMMSIQKEMEKADEHVLNFKGSI